MMKEVYKICSTCPATDVQKMSIALRPLERTNLVSVRKGEMRRPKRHSTIPSLIRDFEQCP